MVSLSVVSQVAARVVVDVAGREVTVGDRVERIILGEGRMLPALGILEGDQVLDRVVGMMGEFSSLDPDGFAAWKGAFPVIEDIPLLGRASSDTFSAEQAIALAPDLAILGMAGHGPGPKEQALIDRFAEAGIPVIFIDFFLDALGNTPKSMTLLGRVLGREAEAKAFVDAHGAILETVRTRVTSTDERPVVFLDGWVGLRDECCSSVGRGVIEDLITAAGGENLASRLIPGEVGLVNPELLLANQPEVYVGTAIGNRMTLETDPDRIVLGPGIDTDLARKTFAAALEKPFVSDLTAVRAGRAHAFWHHYLHTPFNILVLQALAKWTHPDLFADIDPDASGRAFMARFSPVDLGGQYWVDAP
jgi:iron complex transport system substrate-binding protein